MVASKMEQILKSRFRVGDKLSEGPFSVTYRGVLIGSEKPVLIKIYKRGALTSPLIRSMKQRVRDFALINHQGVAKLLDGDYGWQGFYYVREFVAGQSLHELLNRGEKIAAEQVAVLAEQILSALEAAHAKGIIHGALKPTNVFIDNQGLVKLTDFVIEGEIKDSWAQKVEEVMLNGRYASPEELAGQSLTPRSDLFALGLLLYELLTNQPVVKTPGLSGNIQRLKSSAIFNREALAALPRFWRELLEKATQKEPLLRFASATEFRESLEKQHLVSGGHRNEEVIRIFESVVTQYGGEEVDKNSEELQEVGTFKLGWKKEKNRNWLLSVILGLAVLLGLLYAFIFTR